MFFSLPILGQALLWTVLTVLAVGVVRFALARQIAVKAMLFSALGAGLVHLFWVYFFLPAHVGSMNGMWFQIAIVLSTVGIVQGFAMHRAEQARSSANRGRGYSYREGPEASVPNVSKLDLSWKPVWILVGVATLVLVVYPLFQIAINTRFGGDAKEWAAQGNITVAPAEEKLPPTDNAHIVLVDREVAMFKAQAKLGTGNLGSKYKIEKEDFIKQAINGHLYWVVALEYGSWMAQVRDAAGGNQHTPGFIIVDAEDPQADAELLDNLKLRYTTSSMFSQSLLRHLYGKGYTNGNLTEPTIELDDNKRPYMTVTYTYPKFLVGGEQMQMVLLTDMQTGEVQELEPKELPKWIDRVISEGMIKEYVSHWGAYHHPEAGWWTGMFGGGVNQMKIDGTFLVYNDVDEPVLVMGMTSNNGKDRSATGVLVYQTREQRGRFYPGLAGVNLDVSQTLKSIQENNSGNGNKEAAAVVLYNIDGVPTWVAIYTTPQAIGRSFAGIGMLDAHNPQSNVVQYGENKAIALRKYQTYLGQGRPNGAAVNSTFKEGTVSGRVVKANWVNGKLYLVIDSDTKHRYAASPDVAGGNDLVELVVGESVTLEFKDFGVREVEVTRVEYNPNQPRQPQNAEQR